MRKSKVKIKNHFRILTVDDDMLMTATIQAYFQRNGYDVDAENDPYRAIERVREGNYDIMLLDFLMSPICGNEVVEEIRKFNKDIFIILLTGHKSMAPPIKTIRELDIQGYYEKNDRFDQLELLVESCVKSIHQIRQIKQYEEGLSKIIASTPQVYRTRNLEEMADSILRQLEYLIPVDMSFILFELGDRTVVSRARGTNDIPKNKLDICVRFEGRIFVEYEGFMVFPLINESHQ